MTDRELLEMAAKTAGIELGDWYEAANAYLRLHASPNSIWWNPLTDDGDRYRLARACKLRIDFQDGRVFGPYEICYSFTPGNVAEEAYAIVRAAAEIGKEIP